MAIENRDLEAGTKLIARYKKEEYRAEVVAGEEEGKVKYRLSDGRDFKSLSSAGTAITGKACNGWAFWSLKPDRSEGQCEAAEDAETQDEPPAGQFRRVTNQKGIVDGEVRLYCDACKSSFTSSTGQPAVACPEGHYPGEASEV